MRDVDIQMEGLKYDTDNVWKAISPKGWVFHSNKRIKQQEEETIQQLNIRLTNVLLKCGCSWDQLDSKQ